MKKISKIAIECGVSYERVYRTIKNLGIEADKEKGHRLDEYQEDILHNTLFASGFTDTLIFESKMNNPEFNVIEFEQFKKRTYTNRIN